MLFKKKDTSILDVKKKELELEKLFAKEKETLVNSFNEVMYELGLYNKFNKTYRLEILEKKNFGYTANLYLATGLNFNDLETYKTTIQQNLRCMLILNYQSNDNRASVKILTKPIDSTLNYISPNIKANEMFLGLSYTTEPVICDCNKYCMFLLGGATGSGKTRLIYMMLLSWILSSESNQVELYISDIAKKEFTAFQDVKQVRYYSETLEQLRDMTKYLYTKISYRTSLIEPYRKKGLATNIEEYNNLSYTEKLTYNYLLIDEFSIIMPDKSDTKTEMEQKEEILSYLKKISKLGRACGIFIIVCTQKTTKDEIPSIIKNMSAVRISLRANDIISSEVIMGNDSAVGLIDRLAVYSFNGGSKQDLLFAPNLETRYMNHLLKPHIYTNYPKLNINLMTMEMESLDKTKQTSSPKDTSKSNSNYNKNSYIEPKEKTVVKDLPYDIILYDTSKVKIKDETKIDFSKTEKPRKKNAKLKNGWWLLK